MRTYDAEFKRDAVLWVLEKGRSCVDVAEALGIPVGTLYRWVEAYKKHRVDPFPGKGKLHAEDEEFHRMRLIDVYEKSRKVYGSQQQTLNTTCPSPKICSLSFNATVKLECVYLNHFKTRLEAHQTLFEYIEVFYNRYRIHSAIGYLPPEEYEKRSTA